MALTSKVLVRCGVPIATARANLRWIKAAMREFDITTPERARMFLAQVLHESMRLTRFEEMDSGERYEGNRVLGNTQPGDGPRFKGRGPIQITGRWNYTHFGKLVGLDLVNRPGLAAVPRHGWRIAAAYFANRGCNAAADRGDFREVTRLINPALMHFEERRKFYELLTDVDVVPGRGHLRRGDEGEDVLIMTRRLSSLRSVKTGEPYLDGERSRFDAKVERALRAFELENGLKVDGRCGPKTRRALARALREQRGEPVEKQKDGKAPSAEGGAPGGHGRASKPRPAGATKSSGTSGSPNP